MVPGHNPSYSLFRGKVFIRSGEIWGAYSEHSLLLKLIRQRKEVL
jgi:hypothetical protein